MFDSGTAMELPVLISVAALLLLSLSGAHAFVCPKYIFAFGDSLTDTGNAQAEIDRFYNFTAYPYGLSYRFPDRPCERTRFCDGRIVVDFTAQAFRIPFLEPNSRGFPDSAYSHGVNFAYSGGTARLNAAPLPTFFLAREVEKYFAFRARFSGYVDVSTALHLFSEIGGNDFTYAFTAGLSPAEANAVLVDQVLDAIKQSIQKVHDGGAKFFYIFNQPPAGCTPDYLTLFSANSPKDEYGCLSEYNGVFQNFNVKLKAMVDTFRQTWPDTVILLFDWYSATFEIIRNPFKYGIKTDGFRACCGSGGPYNYVPLVGCSSTGTVCLNLAHTLFWDNVHFTQATYRVIATFALSGRFVDGPPDAVNLQSACHLDFSSFAFSIPNPPTPCKNNSYALP